MGLSRISSFSGVVISACGSGPTGIPGMRLGSSQKSGRTVAASGVLNLPPTRIEIKVGQHLTANIGQATVFVPEKRGVEKTSGLRGKEHPFQLKHLTCDR